MKSSLLLKDAQIKGAALNTTQLQSRLKQKDSVMAKYSEEVEEDRKSMTEQIDSQNQQIESLTKQVNAFRNQIVELSNQNQNETRKLEEAIKIKEEEYIRKCNQFCKKLEESGKKCDNLLKKNKELEDEKRQIEKKYTMSLISRNPSSFAQNMPNKTDLKLTSKDSNLTEITMGNDSLTFSAIEQNSNQLKPTATQLFNNFNRKPLQPKDSNTFSNQILMQKSFIEKFQKVNPNLLNDSSRFIANSNNSQTNNISRLSKKRKLNIGDSTFFEYVNQMDEVYSLQKDTSFTKEDQDIEMNKQSTFNNNEETEVLFDDSSFDLNENNSSMFINNHKDETIKNEESVGELQEEITNNQSVDEKEEDEINENENSITYETEELNSLHQFGDINYEIIERVESSNHVSDFLNLLTILINLFLWISLFLI